MAPRGARATLAPSIAASIPPRASDVKASINSHTHGPNCDRANSRATSTDPLSVPQRPRAKMTRSFRVTTVPRVGRHSTPPQRAVLPCQVPTPQSPAMNSEFRPNSVRIPSEFRNSNSLTVPSGVAGILLVGRNYVQRGAKRRSRRQVSARAGLTGANSTCPVCGAARCAPASAGRERLPPTRPESRRSARMSTARTRRAPEQSAG